MKLKVSETNIKKNIKGLLDQLGIFNYHRLAGLACYPGLPDRVIHYKGKVIYIEVKKPNGKLSPAQLEFAAQCIVDQIDYWVIHSVDELIEKLGVDV